MTKLKIAVVVDDKPVTMTIRLPAGVHRDLTAYAAVLKRDAGQAIDPNALVAAMLERFMASDRAFRRAHRQIQKDEG